jgi:hypothetical protein
MDYEIVYDEIYIKPGFIIYKKDYTQFLKIMPNISDKVPSYSFIISDNKLDNPKEGFRQIEMDFKNNTQLEEIFAPLEGLILFSKASSLEGCNQIRVIDSKVKFLKDLTFSKNLYCNAMSLTLSGELVYNLYQKLLKSKKVDTEVHAKVLEKMINLKAA